MSTKKENKAPEFIEQTLAIGLITDDQFIKKIHAFNDEPAHYFASDSGKRIAHWCTEYFKKYGEAPKREIENIFYYEQKEGLPQDVANDIEEDILPELDKAYKKKGNPEHLLDIAKKYFKVRHAILYKEQLENTLWEGKEDLEEFEKIRQDYKPLIEQDSFDKHICTKDEMEAHKIKPPRLIMKPWLREGETTFLYGSWGTGKSLLSILIGYICVIKTTTPKIARSVNGK